MIAITGANGQLGRLVIAALLEKVSADQIIALVRNPDNAADFKAQGIHVRQADYNAPDTLPAALAGVDKLLLISGSEVGQRVPQHKAVIDAAKEAGISLLAYTSILNADKSPLMLAAEHKVTEEMIRESGLPAVILRNGWYNENYTAQTNDITGLGVVAGAVGEGQIASAARRDYAEAAAIVLASAEDHTGKVYELAGSSAFTLAEFAAEIAEQSGKTINYQPMDEQSFKDLLVQVGLPEGFAGALADAEHHASKGWLYDNGLTLEKLLGRKTISLKQSIAEALA
ncbi:SDR family oxidoreductase [Oceanospirillum sediminis]|uniref:SDR family oxidoreductase n=1 Tax=Oceanospirillum sediminis TaxID=2760088 RepID=A0A839IRR1_9GAMM|nr:SDR family oxidoreductase [Oceanospirillum sediminis]MBB1487127.1 SDR family oxidoreductase [Oceanospirillum sediminis]